MPMVAEVEVMAGIAVCARDMADITRKLKRAIAR